MLNSDYESWEIKGGLLEFIPSTHTYLYNGLIIPSVTTLIRNDEYKDVPTDILQKASEKGTKIHKAIEDYDKLKVNDITCKELQSYRILKEMENFTTIQNEIPIVVFDDDNNPICAGRIDLITTQDNEYGIEDIKTTSQVHLDYIIKQLNIYKIGYEQCYNNKISYLKVIHLRNSSFKRVKINIVEKEEVLEWIKK